MMAWHGTYGGATPTRGKGTRGFTLLELLVAFAMFGVLAVALFALFRNAIRLRERTYERIEDVLPRDYIARIIKRDLAGIVQPNGELKFRGDILLESEMAGMAQQDRFEFYTASGKVSGSAPWGDIQKVTYYLEAPQSGDVRTDGYDLVRERTTLPESMLTAVQEPIVDRYFAGVESLDVTWYDGEAWQESLDTELVPEDFPEALKMRFEFVQPEEQGAYRQLPLEIFTESLLKNPDAEEEEAEEGGGN